MKIHPKARRLFPALIFALALLLFTLPNLSGSAVASVSLSFCLQDDSNGNVITVNTSTGAYTFSNCAGFSSGGTGQITRAGSTITLKDNRADRRVQVYIDLTQQRGNASYQRTAPGTLFTITDRNTANDNCGCLGST